MNPLFFLHSRGFAATDKTATNLKHPFLSHLISIFNKNLLFPGDMSYMQTANDLTGVLFSCTITMWLTTEIREWGIQMDPTSALTRPALLGL